MPQRARNTPREFCDSVLLPNQSTIGVRVCSVITLVIIRSYSAGIFLVC